MKLYIYQSKNQFNTVLQGIVANNIEDANKTALNNTLLFMTGDKKISLLGNFNIEDIERMIIEQKSKIVTQLPIAPELEAEVQEVEIKKNKSESKQDKQESKQNKSESKQDKQELKKTFNSIDNFINNLKLIKDQFCKNRKIKDKNEKEFIDLIINRIEKQYKVNIT